MLFRVDIYQEISFFDEHASWGIEKTFPNYLLCHLLHLSQMDLKYQARESDRFSCFRKSNLPMLVLCDLIGNFDCKQQPNIIKLIKAYAWTSESVLSWNSTTHCYQSLFHSSVQNQHVSSLLSNKSLKMLLFSVR